MIPPPLLGLAALAFAGSPAPLPFELVDVSTAAGLSAVHEAFVPHPSLSNIGTLLSALGGASVAVVDFDGDGWPDLYFTNSAVGSKNRLYRNNGDGTYTEVAEKAGLADVNREAGSLRALFFDYDNDGREDLLLTTTWCPRLFHNEGRGRFKDVTARSGLDHCGFTPASIAVDYDGDGLLDVVTGDYFKPVNLSSPAAMDFMYDSEAEASNGGPIIVYHNDGKGRFSRVEGSLGLSSRGFTWAIGAYDLRGTGRPDLYFATDFHKDRLYFNEGGGRFVDASDRVQDAFGNQSMSAEIADLDDDGRPVIFTTQIYLPRIKVERNRLWKVADGPFLEVHRRRFRNNCGGWAWGAQFVDLDNDGHLDLAYTSGMITGRSKEEYWYREEVMAASVGEISSDARHWPPIDDDSWSGDEPKCVYLNDGSGRFIDVSARTPLAKDRNDGRGLAVLDELNNGSPSLVEANWRGPVRLYRSRPNGNHWIGFRLVGRRSNRDAVGARVTVRSGGRSAARELEPANGFLSERDPRIVVGLGPSTKVESAEVRWPSGEIQPLTELEIDRYHTVRER